MRAALSLWKSVVVGLGLLLATGCPPGAIEISVSATTLEVTEGGGPQTFTVQLTGQPPRDQVLTVKLTSSNPAALLVSPANLTFDSATYNVPQTVTVRPLDDANATNEAVTITVAGEAFIATTVNVTVIDDDTQALVVSESSLAVTEGMAGTFTVKLAFQPAGDTSVTLTSSNPAGAAAAPATLVFTSANYATAQTVTVTGVDDVDIANETAVITVASANLPSKTVNVSVTDDDMAGLVVTPASLTVAEGGTGTLNVSLAFRPSADTIVTVVSGNPTAAVAAPTSLTFTPANYATPQTVTVSGVEDPNITDDAVTFSFSATGIPSRMVTVTVTDNDTLQISATPTTLTVAEGATGTVAVKLTAPPTADVVVNVLSSRPAAGTVSVASLTFTALNFDTAQDVVITGTEDNDLANETFTVTLSSMGLSPVVVNVSVTDNDTQAITVTPMALTINEGGTGTFTARLAFQPTGTVTVTAVSSNTQGATISPSALTFTPANYATPQTITVTGVQDANLVDESAIITLTSAGASASVVNVTVTDDDTQNIVVSPASIVVTEGGTTGSFTVALTQQPSANVQVSVTSNDTAAVTVSPATLTFTPANYNTPQTIAVTGVQDTNTVSETVTVSVAATGLTTRTVTVTTTDDDTQAIVVSGTTLALNEGGTVTLTARLAFNPLSSVTVAVGSSNTGAAAVAPASLTFTAANYATPQTLTLTGVEDMNLVNETVTLTLTSSGLPNVVVTVNVTDNDTQGIVVVPASGVTVTEGSTSTFTVALAFQPAANVAVNMAVMNTLAATISATTLNFTPSNYATPQTVTVTGVPDANVTDESTSVTLSSVGLPNVSLSVNVTDDDVQNITLLPTSLNLSEGGANGTFTVQLTNQPTANVTVTLSSSKAAAASVSPATLTFTPGNYNVAQSVTVTPVQDQDTADENVTVSASAPGLTTRTVTVTVADDDTQAIVPSTLGVISLNEGGTATFTVRLAFNPLGTVNVSVASSNTSSATATPSTLTFNASNYTMPQTVTLTGVEDVNLVAEMIAVTLSSPSVANATVGVATVDNDTQRFVITPASTTITEGGNGSFNVSLAFQPAGSVTVSVANSNPSAVTATPTTLTFTSSNYLTPQPINLSGLQDVNLTDETATITLSASGIANASTVITVTDDDVQNLSVTPTSLNLTEGGAAGTFTVQLTNQPSGTVTVSVISAKPAAATVSPASLSFSSTTWNLPQTITVTPVQDNDTANEVVTLTVSSAGLPSRTVTANVTDDDTQFIQTSVASVAVAEGTSTATVGVRLGFNPLGSVSVTVSSSNGGSVTVSPTTLSFNASNFATNQPITLTGVEDVNLVNETVTITLSAAGMSDATVTANVTDNDTQAFVIAPAGLITVNEGGSSTFTVRLAFQPGANTTVTAQPASGADGTKIGVAASLTFTPANYLTPQTVTINGLEDADLVNDNVTVTVTSAGIPTANVAARVIDNDAQSFVVNPSSVSVTEGGAPGSFNVRLAFAPAGNVVVSITSGDPGAATVTSSLTFTPSDYATAQTVTVTPVADNDTRNESTLVTLSAAGIPDATVNVSVADDDVQAHVLSTGALAVVEEGVPATFTVRLAYEPDADVVVTVATADPGAVSRSPASLTFTVGNYATPQVVTVAGVSDPDLVNELVNVSLSSSVAPTATVAVTVTDDDVQDLTVSRSAMTVVEDTGPGTFTVRLAYQPAANVTVTVSTSNASAATASPALLTFTPTNYGAVQTVTVSGTSDANLLDTSAVLTIASAALPSKTINVSVTDDDVQSIVLSSTVVGVNEGATATFTVALAFEPATGTEVVTLVSGDTGAATIAPSPLTFVTGDYNMPRTITVTGVQDADVLNEIVTATLTSDAAGTASRTVQLQVTDDDTQQIIRDLASATITEGSAGTATVRVHLLQDPAGTATVTITSSDPGAATATSSLTFNSGNYTVDQDVVIAPVDDDDVRQETVTITFASPGMANQTTTVTVNDDDVQAIQAAPTSLTVVEESTGVVNVRLAFRPTSDVTITATSDDTAHITVSPATLVFTPTNYATQQAFTLSGVADANLDDNNGITVTLSSSAGQTGPEGSPNLAITVNEEDNDLQRIIVTVANPLPLSVQEGGPTARFQVKLEFPPKGGVDDQVDITSAVPAKLTATSSLVFTTGNFGTDQPVTVQALDDADAVTDTVTLTLSVNGEVPASTATQAVRIIDDEITVLAQSNYSSLNGATEFTKRQNIWFGATGFAFSAHNASGETVVARDSREFGAFVQGPVVANGAEGTPQAIEFDGTAFGVFATSTAGVAYARLAEDFSSTLVGSTTVVAGVDDFWPAWNGTDYGVVYRQPPNNNLFFRRVNTNGTTTAPVQVTTAGGSAHLHPNAHFTGAGYLALYSTSTEVRCVRTNTSGVPQSNVALTGMPTTPPFVSSVFDGTFVVAAYVDPTNGLFAIRVDPSNCAVDARVKVRDTSNFLNVPHIAWNGVEYAVSYDIAAAPNQVGVARINALFNLRDDFYPVEPATAGERPSTAWMGDRWGLRVKGSVRVLSGSFQTQCDDGLLNNGETMIDCGGPNCRACN